jgi:energy-coupling factor transporter ATP-binding protein EcfA2
VVSGTRIGYVPQYVEGGDDELVMDWLLAEYIKIRESLRLSEESLATAPPDEVDSAMKEYREARDSYDQIDGNRRPRQAETVLDSLGLHGIHNQTLGTLSCGEKNVLPLALALLDDPDFLVLDEPGNHLDFMGLAWLEEFPINFKGTVLIVSHKRHTLDRVVQGVLTLEDGQVKRYEGGLLDLPGYSPPSAFRPAGRLQCESETTGSTRSTCKTTRTDCPRPPQPEGGQTAARTALATRQGRGAGRRKTDPGRFRDRRRIRGRKNPCEHRPAAAWQQQIVWRSVTFRKRRPRHHQRRAGGDGRTQRQR